MIQKTASFNYKKAPILTYHAFQSIAFRLFIEIKDSSLIVDLHQPIVRSTATRQIE